MQPRAAFSETLLVRPNSASNLRHSLLVLTLCVALAGLSRAEEIETAGPSGLNSLPEVELKSLSQNDWNPLGARALSIHPAEWKHGETEHFIYHFRHSYVSTPISVEAEFNYRVIAKELGLETMPSATAKSHIYIFEEPADWKIFQGNAHLEPWTGGIHSLGSLFVLRDPSYKFSDNSLGHEIAHLILFRVYQHALPRWLDEGFAEYVSRVSLASFQRARNYIARPHSSSIAAEDFIPLARLTTLLEYPANAEINTFYQESERLVRFLNATDPAAFRLLLDSTARGETFENALSRHYGGRFFDLDALEKEFLSYASKDAKTLAAAP